MKYQFLLTALTPIAHGDTATGVDNATNKRLFMRQGGLVNDFPAAVPAISENALRAVIFRQTLANHLIDALEIQEGSLSQGVLNLLFSGGSIKSGSSAPQNDISVKHQIAKLYPMLDLLGGSVDSMMLAKSKLKLTAWIVCQENKAALEYLSPELATRANVSAFDMLYDETHTRGTGAESSGNQMLYEYETLIAGSEILMEICVEDRTSPATLGAIAFALENWDGFFGGQARQGHGRIKYQEITQYSERIGTLAYLEHIEFYKTAMRDGLLKGTLGSSSVLCA